MSEVILEMKNITKTFPGVKALSDVSFSLKKGEVHTLLGENGAGKSTLIKILSGIYRADSGSVFIDGKQTDIRTPSDAINQGIAVIHQELVLADNISVAENIFMGREYVNRIGFVDFRTAERKVQKIFDELSVDLQAETRVSELTTPQKQVVEIVKALTYNVKIMIMDEPTSSLSTKEVEMLFTIIRHLKEQGISVIYISHRMEEVFTISDRVTVLRDGRNADTLNTAQTNANELIKLMVGREISDFYSHKKRHLQETVLEVQDISTPDFLKNCSFKLYKGEILGFAGLVGSGRSELARAIFGIDKKSGGRVLSGGKLLNIRSPRDAVRNGIVLIPESRKEEGLVLGNTVGFNITLCVLEKFLSGIFFKRKTENDIIDTYFSKLSIKASSAEQTVGSLSGGNQQKAVIAKWLATKPRIIIMDEPTRGIDVGAKAEIYALMDELTKDGVSIVMISSELPEILGMCDRICVMNNGKIAACLGFEEATQESIMNYAAGVQTNEK